ncbi:MAG TPA: hypothetical protein VKT28_10335 [Puia sp.]|nr:hypothetical protein [Puia sp.]
MKKRLSGMILAAEIAAIMLLHAYKLNHQPKNDGQQKTDIVSEQMRISSSYSFTSLK